MQAKTYYATIAMEIYSEDTWEPRDFRDLIDEEFRNNGNIQSIDVEDEDGNPVFDIKEISQ